MFNGNRRVNIKNEIFLLFFIVGINILIIILKIYDNIEDI